MTRPKASLLKCVEDYSARTKGNFSYQKNACQTIGIARQTWHEWFDKIKLPGGINMLKLILLLEINGYEITELKDIPVAVRQYGRLVALGILDANTAAQMLGVMSSDNLLRILLGRSGTTEQKIKKIENALDNPEIKKLAEEKLRQWTIALVFNKKTEEKESTQVSSRSGINHETALKILADLAKVTVPLAEWIVSDEFTADERRRLREFSSNGRSNNVFELSNLLNALCSETARKEIK